MYTLFISKDNYSFSSVIEYVFDIINEKVSNHEDLYILVGRFLQVEAEIEAYSLIIGIKESAT